MTGQINNERNLGKCIKEATLLELFSGNDLVIPEIQREYVWGDCKIGRRVLASFFGDFIGCVKKFKENEDESSARNKRLDSRIGFVYAYVPGYAMNGERRLTAYLIDGQQRVTTFFLMWLHLAKKSGRIAEFASIQQRNGIRAFDFKVRPLTHMFVDQLVKSVVDESDFDFSAIEDATWFLSDYRHDVSIMSMVNALKVWDGTWRASDLDADIAYKYLTNHVSLWLFVMNETAQGEQLYITMNGRGRNLSEDEIIRAKVFRDAVASGEHVATDVGCLFEAMTDFFWTHRVKGELNSDKGMRKFFRWGYLIERYQNELDQEGRPEFSAALTNERAQEGKGFELEETMFGQGEETNAGRITFTLIKNTFENLKRLYDPDLQVSKFLRGSVLEDSDVAGSFQQDCFVLLPLLHWLNKLQRQPDSDDVRQFARYLRKMASKNDVQRRPAQAVPSALKLAEMFAEFKDKNPNGDLLDFLSAETTRKAKLSQMVYPEEEATKAKCLLSVRDSDRNREEGKKLFEKYKGLLGEVEEYKSNCFENDYQISGFLGIHIEWEKCEWNQTLIDEYTCAFNCFKKFWGRPNSLQKFRLLVAPCIEGYFETRLKLFPYDLVRIFGNTDAIKKIVNFEKRVVVLKSVDAAFKESEREFLKAHWNWREFETNPRVLCALALIVHRLAGGQFNDSWTKVQFEHNYFDNKDSIKNPKFRAVGKSGFYFWFMDVNDQKWRYSRATEGRLLDCHKKMADEADNLVQKFLETDECQ